jgi:hypothetical protein
MKRKKQNRKMQSQGFIFPVPLTLFLVMVTIISMAYLWLHSRCEAAGVRIQQLEKAKQESHQRVLQEETRWARTKTLPNVQTALQRHGLHMGWASNDRIVRISRPALATDREAFALIAQASGANMDD